MEMYKKSRTDRVTVAEAASRLGVKEQAIRKRIQRGTLVHDKDEHGRVYVYLDVEDQATGTGIDAGVSTLVQSLQDQIAYLRQEAEAWKEEARRKDTIIMSLTQRIPELEAPSEPREASAAAMGSATNSDNMPSQNQDPSQDPSERRLWWRKFFGF